MMKTGCILTILAPIIFIAAIFLLSTCGSGSSGAYTDVEFEGITFRMSEGYIVEDIGDSSIAIMLEDGSPQSSITIHRLQNTFASEEDFLTNFIETRVGLSADEHRESIERRARPLGGNSFRVLEYWIETSGTAIDYHSYFLFRNNAIYEFTLMQLDVDTLDISNDFERLLGSVD